MLFISLAKVKAGTTQERVARRMQWQYPPGMRVLGEYWPVGGEYSVVTIAEGDSIEAMMAATGAWDDVLEFTIMPAVTAEEGLRLFQKMMPG
jgi:uncharacterized protein with GYD domain